MSMFMQALFEGIINGSTLALVAMGIALVWGVMGILSFTQGEFLMIAMFCSFYLNLYFGLDPIVSLPICMAIMFGIGFIVYKLIIARALRGAGPLAASDYICSEHGAGESGPSVVQR